MDTPECRPAVKSSEKRKATPFYYVSEPVQIISAFVLALAIMWGFGIFVYGLAPAFLAVPSLFVLAICGPLLAPFLVAKWLTKRRAAKAGLCPTCAYDLRAHRPGDKCPECGTPIAAKP